MNSQKRSPRIFYGWWIVAAMVVTSTYMGGVVFYGFTAFIEPIEQSFPSWSRTAVTLSLSLRGMESGLLAPFAGKLVDRYGPRRLIAIGSIVVALSLVMLSKVSSLWMFYLAFGVMALGMSCCTLTVPMTAVANWFRKKLGIASAFAIVGFGLSGILVPLIVKLIDVFAWRNTFLILALGVVVIIMPLSLVFRHKPEPYGYLPDGEKEPPASSTTEVVTKSPDQRTWRVREVLGNGVFWRITIAYICHMMLVSAIMTHLMPYLESVGIARTAASFVTMALALTSIVGRLSFGWLADRYESKSIAVTAFALMSLAIGLFVFVSGQAFWLLIPFVIIFSTGHGGNNALRSPMVSAFFGRGNFGTVLGLMMGICSIGGVLGPPLAARIWDVTGSYNPAWYAALGIAVIGMISVWSIPKMKPKRQF
ncbi:MFS transporter [Chloroflexota bacterium]